MALNWSSGARGLALHLGAMQPKQVLFGDQRPFAQFTFCLGQDHMEIIPGSFEKPFPSDNLRLRLGRAQQGVRVEGLLDQLTQGHKTA